MANTTFSGPIRTGSISHTTGTSVGTDVKNIGWVQNSQAFFVSIGDTTVSTTVVIPARSMITAIHGHVTEVFDSGTSDDFDIGTAVSSALYVNGTSVGDTIGFHNIGGAVANTSAWTDIGATDQRIVCVHNAAGTAGSAGKMYVVIDYLQHRNFNNVVDVVTAPTT
tara:strand:+ start:3439 stop:3936 length:498 start_codon:yes stop_codon:yes gene_type:complete